MPRISRKLTVQSPQKTSHTVWHTALYARLSVEDNGSHSTSIATQLALMDQYIATHPCLCKEKIYVDNGFTGTNTNRPSFQAMMRDLQNGTVNCVLTKDLSRLGRSYLDTCHLLERVFPAMGVRFITIQNRVDTLLSPAGGLHLSTALENIINEMYARDISQKVSTALAQKMQQGEFIGTYAPYGYQKDPANKNHLIPDEKTAPTVQLIFTLRKKGMSYEAISRYLNEAGVPSPYCSKHRKGRKQSETTAIWSRRIVTALLHHPVYMGHMVQRRKNQYFYETLLSQPTAGEIVVKNTHEAIISEALFQEVQKINQTAAQKSKRGIFV